MPKTAQKDTIYVDVEDEITAVIDKVSSAKSKIVALVLPKRSTVFSSAVNLKLLKKAAVSEKKNIVLITSDTSIVSLAGAAGMHVAKTPTSKPEIPTASKSMTTKPEVEEISEAEAGETDPEPVALDDDDAIEIDNTDAAAVDGEGKKIKTKKKKIAKIPDFSSFKLRMALGIGAVVLLFVLWYFGFVVAPKATVTINTDTSTTAVDTTVTARISTEEVDTETGVIPAKRVQVDKVESVKVEATGEKNVGTKATGRINLTNCIKSDGVQVVPAGTRFSAGGNTYETTEQAILPEATFNFSGQCRSKEVGDDKTVSAAAIEPGEKYNISGQSLTSSISGIVAVGSNMTGGTSRIIKVVAQADVDKAVEEISANAKSRSLDELKKQLEEQNVKPIDATITEGTAKIVSEPAVGAEASETTVTKSASYSMIGVSEDAVGQILNKEIEKIMADRQQNIRDNGQSKVEFTVIDKPNENDIRLGVKAVASVGPDMDEEILKAQVAGKKRGDIEKELESIEGVRSVSVEYSPFWISTTPKSAKKVNIIFNEGNGN